MSTGYHIQKYAREKGYTERKALNDRQTHAQEWLKWCKEQGITPDADDAYRGSAISAGMKRKNKTREKTPKDTEKDTVMKIELDDNAYELPTNERYKSIEDTSYRQVRLVQAMLDTALAQQDIPDVKLLSGAVDTALRTLDTATKSRVAYDMLAGRYIPASIIDEYKMTFYPLINQSVDNLRLQLLSLLPDEYKATVQSAWLTAYNVYADGVQRAEAALVGVTENARELAEKEINKGKSKVLKG